jgi:lipopolysaccharide export system permease protein
MNLSPTLNRYLARTYFFSFLFMLGMLLALIFVFDTLELLRRASKEGQIPLSVILEMGILKLPDVGQITLPFAVLFSAMFTFWKLNRRSELVIVRSAGFSVWQFLAPVLSVGFCISLFYLTMITPISSAMLTRYQALEDRLIFHRTSSVTLLKEGLWLRQDQPDGHLILHAEKVDQPGWVLHDVMVLYFGEDDGFQRRLDAPTARLEGGQWIFDHVSSNRPDQQPELLPTVRLATDLTSQQIEDSFSSPNSVSFWQMPGYIQTMEETGFDPAGMKVHFNALLAMPLMFGAMILIAAAVSLRPPRFRGMFAMVMTGVIGGFILFFLSSFLQALGASHQIPVLAAAWAAPLVAALVTSAVILHVEDG